MTAGVPGPTSGLEWNEQYHHDLNYIGELVMEHKIFQAIQYIMTSFFPLMSNFTEDYRMASQAKIERGLSYLQQQRDKIEQNFDDYQHALNYQNAQKALNNGSYVDYARMREDVQNALQAYKNIENLFSGGEINGETFKGVFSSTFQGDVNSQLKIIFDGVGPTNVNPDDPTTIHKIESELWTPAWTWQTPDPNDKNPPKEPMLQTVTNALTAIATKFSSESSTVQSQTSYYEKWDEQFMTFMHVMMSNNAKQEQSPNNNMQSAAS